MTTRRDLLLLALAALPAGAHPEDRATAATRRVAPELRRALESIGRRLGSPMLLRIFKLEGRLEAWAADPEGWHAHFREWPICTWSGTLGPKRREGDGQAPEGFYEVTPGRMNPYSAYHLSFDLGYPNRYDRSLGRTGSHLMVHGRCVSIGCYAMGDAAIEEIYTLVAAAQQHGQRTVPVHAFPFRFDREDLAQRLAHPRWGAFWSNLREGWDAFERTRRAPHIDLHAGRYRVAAG